MMKQKLMNIFDQHNIFFILPSFTEGQPMALLESLSRLRPVNFLRYSARYSK